ncbi:hypothetical protein Csa_013488, partial [Cucumis sativus]
MKFREEIKEWQRGRNLREAGSQSVKERSEENLKLSGMVNPNPNHLSSEAK